MAWFDTERFGSVVKRAPLIQPYNPGVTERLGTTSGDFSAATDVGKPVKLSGSACVLCASGDEIYGFIESIEAGTESGYSIGTVLCKPGHEFLARDEAGSLSVGDLVVAGTAKALGTANETNGPNVVVRTGAISEGQSALYNSGGLAIKTTGSAIVKTVNTIRAMVGGTLVSKAAADMAALSGTVANGTFNVFAFFIDAAGTLSTVMGTAGATLADVVVPQATPSRAMIGFVIINPTGTGDFVGGTTPMADATVVPNTVYVDTVGIGAQQIAGTNLWQVMETYGSGAGRQCMVRKL